MRSTRPTGELGGRTSSSAGGAWPALVPASESACPLTAGLGFIAPRRGAEAWAEHPCGPGHRPRVGLYGAARSQRPQVGDHRARWREIRRTRAGARRGGGGDHSLTARLAGFDRYQFTLARACYYAVEPEERFLVERLGRAWVLAACSGHAFKFGPVLGQRLAEAIEGRIDASELARWAAGRPI